MTWYDMHSRTEGRYNSNGSERLLVTDLGRQPYASVLALQRRLRDLRARSLLGDVLLLLEHESVFTHGKRVNRRNLLVSTDDLQERGIALLSTERGGDITYHGPGQLVGYPIVKLPGQGRHVKAYVHEIEEVLIQSLRCFGIAGARMSGKPGVWVGDSKIGFVGIAVKEGVSIHGFALNVDMDLTPFSWIHPCGLRNTAIVCMKDLLNPPPSVKEVKRALVSVLSSRWGCVTRWITMRELEKAVEQRIPLSIPAPSVVHDASKT